jgi:ribosomal protein S18 acetylase RimI-like enzyme
MILRPATEADIPALAQLGSESFVAKFGQLYREEDLNSFLDQVYSESAIAADIADPLRTHCLAAEGEDLLGYCKLGLKSNYADHSDVDNAIDLMQLYTQPGLTGRGIGAALMDWALDEAKARRVEAILLTVFSENFGAQRFYERYGFSKIADIYFMVGTHRDDEFLYELKLPRVWGISPSRY